MSIAASAPAADIFAEALAVPAIIHTPATAARALALGPSAASLLMVASRYNFAELVYLGDDAPPTLRSPSQADRRLRILPGSRDLPRDWYADVIAVAAPGTPESVLKTARELSSPATVVVIAVDRFNAGAATRLLLRKYWRVVVPYRENLPGPQLYFLASDVPLAIKRPIPSWTKRISDSYMTSLFRLAKDEYQAVYGPPPVVPTVANLIGPKGLP